MRVAVVSFLFNWPSTGGGNVHTAELCRFLQQAGYDVLHLYPVYLDWQIGEVEADGFGGRKALRFTQADWNRATIQLRFRQELDRFRPDCVILTDSWNMKPVLAEAAAGYPYILRFQALEVVCPLNNIRLLPGPDGGLAQCGRNQLDEPRTCRVCVAQHAQSSGSLHRDERELSGFGSSEYEERLQRVIREAAAILVVNEPTAEIFRRHNPRTHVVTAGMDPARFPWPWPREPEPWVMGPRKSLFFAGLTSELIKGYPILEEACRRLYRRRQDFEMIVTGEPVGRVSEFTRQIGWRTQAELPAALRAADIVVVPAIAQEALGRTAVEGMAVGRPVIASRIGGLPETLGFGEAGLLVEPGDPDALAAGIERLLDDRLLRAKMGHAGRQRFELHYTWPVIIERHYRPLLERLKVATPTARPSPQVDEAFLLGIDTVPELITEPPTAKVGCILAIRDRDPKLLERTMTTFRWQSRQPAEKVLLDYGSSTSLAKSYQELCQREGWCYVRHGPTEPRWWLADAYNRAAAALSPDIDVVFKSDVDVLLGDNVLALAAVHGSKAFTQFECITLLESVTVPDALDSPLDFWELVTANGKSWPSAGRGLFACPRAWFERAGGFDLAFWEWGYEDYDLALRAKRALGMTHIPCRRAVLLHQWHPVAVPEKSAHTNRTYFEQARRHGEVQRNGGLLVPPASPTVKAHEAKAKVVVATRSQSAELFELSGRFLRRADLGGPFHWDERVRLMNVDALEYFRCLLELDADWVVSLDEDAFLTNGRVLSQLIEAMAEQDVTFAGMPDGGVVPIRFHNPAVPNAFFVILNLNRARSLLAEWGRVQETRSGPERALDLPAFAKRTPWHFDDFEPYYPFFLRLLERGERFLCLRGESAEDGTTTILHGPDEQPFLYHAWYGRDYEQQPATRARIDRLIRRLEEEAKSPAKAVPLDAPGPREDLADLLVLVHVYNRIENAERWLRAWSRSDTGAAQIGVIHNQDRPEPRGPARILRGKPDVYLARENRGFDLGAFQEVVGDHHADLLPPWEWLLWCTDDFLPLRPDFLRRFAVRAGAADVGLVAGRWGWWPGHFSGKEEEKHCRTVGFLIRRTIAKQLKFPADPMVTREQCLTFEHRPGHLLEQVRRLGWQVACLDDADADIMWDANHEAHLNRWAAYFAAFGS